jgi:hypothetical protein
MPPTTPRVGDYVEIVTATYAEAGIRGRLARIDDADPDAPYFLHLDGGLVAWAGSIRRPVVAQPAMPTTRARRRRRRQMEETP